MLARLTPLLAILALGCPSPGGPDENPNRVPREITSPEGDIGVVVDGHNQFTWELYASLATQAGDGNVFFSPFSVTEALGMTMAGAEGQTETEMKAVLHATGDEAAWHAALGSLGQDLGGDFDRGYTLHIANRLFGQTDYPWQSAFLDTCDTAYGAPLEEWDFRADPDGGRVHVNDWVAEQTEDRIEDLLPAGSVNDGTRMILANAIYFLADWQLAFDPDETVDAPFTRLDGSTVTVPMMKMKLEELEEPGIEAGWTDTAALLRLPYQDDEVSMVLVIPHDDQDLAAVEADLDSAWFDAALATLGYTEAEIGLPRLELEYEQELSGTLAGLGMPTAFTDAADFTGLAADVPEDGPLKIKGVFHKAFVKVDEAGTEAAAATGVVVGTDSYTEPIIADRPFLFVIRDDLTGAILFVGRVTDPS